MPDVFLSRTNFLSNISNTRKSVSSDTQTLGSGSFEVGHSNEAHPSDFFNQLQSVWISDEKFFPVFDIAPQSINKS